MSSWQENLVEDREGARALLREAKRIAVIGIKPESKSDQPAHYVSAYLQDAGYEVIPVPCYFPDITEILGQRVYRSLDDVPGEIDLAVIFRRPSDVTAHLDELLRKQPRAVWMQSGIRNERVAEQLAQAGIKVVQDRCTMVEHRFMG